MTFRRSPEQRKETVADEPRDSDQYEFDDARHFATRQSGQSGFAQKGQSHEEHMQDDNSGELQGSEPQPGAKDTQSAEDVRRMQVLQSSRPTPEPPRDGYYGSGGSYGYGGGFDHGGQRGPEEEYRAGGDPGRGNEEFYEATGGFGRDVSAYGREGLGFPGNGENRQGTGGTPGGGVHEQAGHRYFNEDGNRATDRYFNESGEDAQQGFTQHAGYAQSGGQEQGQQEQAQGQPAQRQQPQAKDGTQTGARGSYTRADDRIREDLCEQLDHGEIDPSLVTVEVAGGTVKLEGSVESRYAKQHAQEIAESVMGVRAVQNRLEVRKVSRTGGTNAG
jgi:osmotically-inducible protein OsmY